MLLNARELYMCCGKVVAVDAMAHRNGLGVGAFTIFRRDPLYR